MKKIKSILAIVALTMICAGAFAEPADAFRRYAGGGSGGGKSCT